MGERENECGGGERKPVWWEESRGLRVFSFCFRCFTGRGTEDILLVMEGKKKDVGGMCGWLRKSAARDNQKTGKKNKKGWKQCQKRSTKWTWRWERQSMKSTRGGSKGSYGICGYRRAKKNEMAEENCVRSKEVKNRESIHRKTMDPTVGRKLGKASECPAVGVLWRPPMQQAMAELRPRRSISSVHRLSPSLTECSILVYELPGS